MKKLLSTLIIILPIYLQAQDSLKIEMDPMVKMIIDKRIELNKNKASISGYRVQIFFGSQRTDANKIRSDFDLLNPEVPSYLIYQAPNFKVRVGDFRTRLEANKFYQEIVKQYPSVFIVEDEISLPKINSQKVEIQDEPERKN